jgi:hypothetical protein
LYLPSRLDMTGQATASALAEMGPIHRLWGN